MDTTQRAAVRQSLLATGFNRTGIGSDVSGVGDYTETWTHADGSTIALTWAPREVSAPRNRWRATLDEALDRREPVRPRPDDSSGSIDAATLASASEQVQQIAAATESPDGSYGWDGKPVQPEVLVRFLNQPVRISRVDATTSATETREGVVHDVFRFSETALAVRLSERAEAEVGDNVMVLGDDEVWRVEGTGTPALADEVWHPRHPLAGA